MRYYISAASSNHGRARTLANELDVLGHVCAYDWLSKPDPRLQALSEGEMAEIAFNMVQSIRDAELFLFLCPTVRSAQVELGLALSSRYGKRIILWSDTGREFATGPETCVFYHHPSATKLTCSFAELIEHVKTI